FGRLGRASNLTASAPFFLTLPRHPRTTLFPYTTLFRSLKFTTNPAATYTADDTISVVVKVQDAYGNTVTDGTGSAASVSLALAGDRKSTRLNSSHVATSYAVVCSKKNLHVRTPGTGYNL